MVFPSGCEGKLGVALESREGTRASRRVLAAAPTPTQLSPPPPHDPSPLRGTLGSSLRSPAEGEGAPSRARTLEAGKRWARLAQARAASRKGLCATAPGRRAGAPPLWHVDVVWGLPRCVWARQSTAPAQGNQSLSRELRASALCPGLEAQFPARWREERGCGPVTGKDRASCQSGGQGSPASSLVWRQDPGLLSRACRSPGTGRGDRAHREPLVEVGNAPGARPRVARESWGLRSPAFLCLTLLPLCLVSTPWFPQPKGPPTAPLPHCSLGDLEPQGSTCVPFPPISEEPPVGSYPSGNWDHTVRLSLPPAQ